MEETGGEIDIKERNGGQGKKRCEEGEWQRNVKEIQEKWKGREEEEIQIGGMGKKGRGGNMRKINVSEGKKINIMKRNGKNRREEKQTKKRSRKKREESEMQEVDWKRGEEEKI